MHKLFAVCTPGLEPFLHRELLELGLVADPGTGRASSSKKPGAAESDSSSSGGGEASDASTHFESGGIEFEGDLRAIYRANLHLRTATRILLRLSTIQARSFEQLREKIARMPWKYYLRPGEPVAVRATCHKSKLYHTEAVARRVADAIGERLGATAPLVKHREEDESSGAARLIVVRLVGDRCTVSVDTSGAPLYQRGYRQATAKAPLRETLAAAMILASGWDHTSPLVDPFCGSGTIPIEAALLARGIPPGFMRTFAYMDWPNFDPALWEAVRNEKPAAKTEEVSMPVILGADRDAGAIRAARANADRAGVANYIQFVEQAVSALHPPPGPGWIITNPPYGVRISGKHDLRNLYAKFGAVLRERCSGWRIVMLSSHPQFPPNTGLFFDEGIPLRNGGLRVRMVQTTV